MPSAVVMFFDSPTENIILKMWGKLAEHGISTEIRASGIRPHITLAVYEQLDCRDCEKRLAGLSERLDRLEIQATHLGIFFQPEAVLFLAPSVTEQLLDFHAEVIETLKQDTGSCWDIYLPGNWVPHCTLAINLELEELNRAISLCSRIKMPVPLKVTGMRVVDFVPAADLSRYDPNPS